MTNTPKNKHFGQRWRDLISNDDDRSEECKSGSTAFATTERAGPLDTISGTIHS